MFLPIALAGLLIATSENGVPHAGWKNGPPANANDFPIAVWLQDPARTPGRYKAAGINLYVGLWQGPTEDQLAELKGRPGCR